MEEEDASLEKNENFFSEEKKEEYLNEENFDSFITKMNDFIKIFDEEEGKANKVTFKAIASNLDWSIEKDAKAFAKHCKKEAIADAEEIIAFLFYQFNNNPNKFEDILNKMN